MNIVSMIGNLKNWFWRWSPNDLNGSIEQIFSRKDFQKLLEIERCRVNRNGGKFVVIVFKLEEIRLKTELLAKLAQGIFQRARMSDQMGWYDDKRLGIILPETSPTGAQKFIQDLYKNKSNGMPRPKFEFYVYPSRVLKQ